MQKKTLLRFCSALLAIILCRCRKSELLLSLSRESQPGFYHQCNANRDADNPAELHDKERTPVYRCYSIIECARLCDGAEWGKKDDRCR